MAGPEGKKVLKFKLVEEKEGEEDLAPAGGKVSFKIPGAAKPGGLKLKLKILDERAPASLRGLEGAPGVTAAALRDIKSMLEDMNKYQKRLAELEKLHDEEEDKRLLVEGELKALKPQLEEAKAELKKYRQMEKEHIELQQVYEKLSKEKAELEAMYAKEDLKNLKESLWAVDGYMDRLKRDLKEGVITEKEYEIKTKHLLKEKWDAQHKMLILEGILKKAIAKTELVEVAREKHVKEFKLKKKEVEEAIAGAKDALGKAEARVEEKPRVKPSSLEDLRSAAEKVKRKAVPA